MKKLFMSVLLLTLHFTLIAQGNDDSGIYISASGEKLIVKESKSGIMVTNGTQVIPLMRIEGDTYMNPMTGLTCILYDDYIMFGKSDGQLFIYKKFTDHAADGKRYMMQGQEMLQKMEWQEAIGLFELAIESENKVKPVSNTRLANDYQGLGLANMGIFMQQIEVDEEYNYQVGESAPVVDNLKESARYFNKAHDPKSEALIYNGIASFYKNLFDYKNALDYYQKAADIFEKRDQEAYAVQLSNMAGCYSQLNDWENARKYLEKGFAIMEPRMKTRQEKLEYCMGMGIIGNTYVELGRYDEAMEYFEKQLRLARELQDKSYIFNYYLNKAIVQYDMGRLESALQTYQEARTVLEGDDVQSVNYQFAQLDKYEGEIISLMGNKPEGERRLLRALEVFREYNDVMSEVNTINLLSGIYVDNKEYDKAIGMLTESVDLIKESAKDAVTKFNSDGLLTLGRIWGKVYTQLAYARTQKGDYAKALNDVMAGIKMATRFNERPSLVAAYAVQGSIYYKMKNYPGAIESIQQSVNLITDIRKGVKSKKLQRDYQANMISNYHLLAMTYFKSKAFNNLFDVMEKSSNTIFGEQLANKTGINEIPYIDLEAFRQQMNAKSLIAKYYLCAQDTGLMLSITNKMVNCREFSPSNLVLDARQVIKNKSILDGDVYNKRGFKVVTAKEPASAKEGTLKNRQTQFESIITYYCYLLSRNPQYLRGAPATPANDKQELIALSKVLYKHLIKPLEVQLADKDEIIIHPDGILAYLPFETLVMDDGRYLCQKFDVRYQQSLFVASLLSTKNENTNGPSLILGGAVYDQKAPSDDFAKREPAIINQAGYEALDKGGNDLTTFYNNYQWNDLPGTLQEANEIAKIGSNHTLLTGDKVTETMLKEMNQKGELEKFRVLHFATHGLVVPEVPELSALILSLGIDRQNDGYFNMNDIYQLKLNAGFVNLSACETGRGKIYRGEGVVGLTQAFLLAGAKGVSVSLWSISDQGTTSFMIEMYKKVFVGDKSFAKAMKLTKIDFISGKFGEEFRKPVYWAPFVYYGITSRDQTVFFKMALARLNASLQLMEKDPTARKLADYETEHASLLHRIGSQYFDLGVSAANEGDYQKSNQYFDLSMESLRKYFSTGKDSANSTNDPYYLNIALRIYMNQIGNYKKISNKALQTERLKKAIEASTLLYQLTKNEEYNQVLLELRQQL